MSNNFNKHVSTNYRLTRKPVNVKTTATLNQTMVYFKDKRLL